MSGAVVGAVVGVLAIGGALFILVAAVGMLRSRDAISRVNTFSPATGVGIPLIILAALVHDIAEHGWSTSTFLKVVLSVAASLVVSTVGSNMLARAAYRSQTGLDPATRSNALAPDEDSS